MLTADRIVLAPVTPPRAAAAPETVMLGHCSGRVEWRRLLAMPPLVRRMERLGFAREIGRLRVLAAAGGPADFEEDRLARLLHLPLPLGSVAAFDALFPEARTALAAYRTPLGGSRTWLPDAVSDFFAVQAEADAVDGLTLWVVPVAEEDGARAFLPDPQADHASSDLWHDLGAFEIAMLPLQAGIVAFPDLERLSIPEGLEPSEPFGVPRPEPSFLPCDTRLPPRANAVEAPAALRQERAIMADALAEIAGGMERLRPDMHALLHMPFASEVGARGLPGPELAALAALLRQAEMPEGGAHRVQALYPYLAVGSDRLGSAAGVLAARMAAETLRRGAWRSVAGRPLLYGTQAWPPVDLVTVERLREENRLGVLATVDGSAVLDDERVAAQALSRRRGPGSGEVSRFVGWLHRELTAFGNRLVFDVDPRDPRPGIALESFLRRLHAAGALGGRTADTAFSLRQHADGESRLVFEIALRLAPPIDRIHVTLSSHRLELTAGGPTGA